MDLRRDRQCLDHPVAVLPRSRWQWHPALVDSVAHPGTPVTTALSVCHCLRGESRRRVAPTKTGYHGLTRPRRRATIPTGALLLCIVLLGVGPSEMTR